MRHRQLLLQSLSSSLDGRSHQIRPVHLQSSHDLHIRLSNSRSAPVLGRTQRADVRPEMDNGGEMGRDYGGRAADECPGSHTGEPDRHSLHPCHKQDWRYEQGQRSRWREQWYQLRSSTWQEHCDHRGQGWSRNTDDIGPDSRHRRRVVDDCVMGATTTCLLHLMPFLNGTLTI